MANYENKKSNCKKALNLYKKAKKFLIRDNNKEYIDIQIGIAKANRLLFEFDPLSEYFIDAFQAITSANDLYCKTQENPKALQTEQREHKDNILRKNRIEKEKMTIILKYIMLTKDIDSIEFENIRKDQKFYTIIETFRTNMFKEALERIKEEFQSLEDKFHDNEDSKEDNDTRFLQIQTLMYIAEITSDSDRIREIDPPLEDLINRTRDNNKFLHLNALKLKADLYGLEAKIIKESQETKRHLINTAIDRYENLLKTFDLCEYPELYAEIRGQTGYFIILGIRLTLDIDHPDEILEEHMKNQCNRAYKFFQDNLQYYNPDIDRINYARSLNYTGEMYITLAQIFRKSEEELNEDFFNTGISKIQEAVNYIDENKYGNTWFYRNIKINIADSYFYTSTVSKKVNIQFAEIIDDKMEIIDKSIAIYEEMINWIGKEFSFTYGDLNQKLSYCYLRKYILNAKENAKKSDKLLRKTNIKSLQKENTRFLQKAKSCFEAAKDISCEIKKNLDEHTQSVSLNYYNKCYKIEDYDTKTYFYLGLIASFYSSRGLLKSNIDEAIKNYKEAEKLCSEDYNPHFYARICNNLGDSNNKLFIITGRKEYFKEALKYYNKALNGYTQDKHQQDWIFVSLNKAYLYNDMALAGYYKEYIPKASAETKKVYELLTQREQDETYWLWIRSCKISNSNLKFRFESRKEDLKKYIVESKQEYDLSAYGYEIKYRFHLGNCYRLKILKILDKNKTEHTTDCLYSFCQSKINSVIGLLCSFNKIKISKKCFPKSFYKHICSYIEPEDKTIINSYIQQSEENYDRAEELLKKSGNKIELDDIQYFYILYNKARLYFYKTCFEDDSTRLTDHFEEIDSLFEKIQSLYYPISDYPLFELKIKVLEAKVKFTKFFTEENKQITADSILNICDEIETLLNKNFTEIPTYFKAQKRILRGIGYFLLSNVQDAKKQFKETMQLLEEDTEYTNLQNDVQKLVNEKGDYYTYIKILLYL